MAKKDVLMNLTSDSNTQSNVSYNAEVIATIVGAATNEVEGVANIMGSGSFNDYIKKSKNITKGIKVELGTEEVSVEINLSIDYGKPMHKVAYDVQNNVKKTIESMTGLHVERVNIHILGVDFEKENETIKNIVDKLNLNTENE